MDTEREARVRERAYAIWEREGRPEGGAEQHWAQAEAELRAEEGAGGAGAEAPPVVEAGGTAGQGAASGAAGTETWTGQDGSVGGEPEAGTEAGKDQ